jgi:hypothetical protein
MQPPLLHERDCRVLNGSQLASTERHHLDFAIAEFREMKMQPSLERALRHKELLKA